MKISKASCKAEVAMRCLYLGAIVSFVFAPAFLLSKTGLALFGVGMVGTGLLTLIHDNRKHGKTPGLQ
jgi:hypothetical protein